METKKGVCWVGILSFNEVIAFLHLLQETGFQKFIKFEANQLESETHYEVKLTRERTSAELIDHIFEKGIFHEQGCGDKFFKKIEESK